MFNPPSCPEPTACCPSSSEAEPTDQLTAKFLKQNLTPHRTTLLLSPWPKQIAQCHALLTFTVSSSIKHEQWSQGPPQSAKAFSEASAQQHSLKTNSQTTLMTTPFTSSPLLPVEKTEVIWPVSSYFKVPLNLPKRLSFSFVSDRTQSFPVFANIILAYSLWFLTPVPLRPYPDILPFMG